jgi:hypothetical protein
MVPPPRSGEEVAGDVLGRGQGHRVDCDHNTVGDVLDVRVAPEQVPTLEVAGSDLDVHTDNVRGGGGEAGTAHWHRGEELHV